MKGHQSHLVLIGYTATVLLCLFACSTCSNGDSPAHTVDDKLRCVDAPSFSTVASASTKFGFKLIADLRKREPGQNIFISPLSLSIALTMTYNGAAGETERAMAEVLEIKGLKLDTVNQSNAALRRSLETPNRKVELSISNSIWFRKGVEFAPEFLDRNRQFFETEIASLDFINPEAPGIINGWVATNTKGKIKRIVQLIDPGTLIFLINAIYFKGSWQTEFDKSETRDGVFQMADGGEKKVRMMRRQGAHPYFRGENFEAASLPYGDGSVSMYIFLPDHDSNLNEFLADLNAANWRRWSSQFREVRKESRIILPRFKLEYEVKLNDTLKALGMGIAFEGAADFSGMGPSLFISEVRHKTFVEVDEQGTQAAAVTVVVGVRSVLPIFRVNRPFFFAIYNERTTTILFMGIVTEPM